jgi:tetratricopeptide (TPR) repeat protein
MRRFLYTVLVQFFVLFAALGQNGSDAHLKSLDSLAFAALESNSADVLDKAEDLLEASLKIKPSFYRVNAYTIFGIVNKDRGFYVTSLDYYLKALNAAEQIKDIPRRSACLNNIGSVYQLQGNYEQAIKYFDQSLELEKQLNDPLQKSIRYYNLGECYKDINNLEMALTYFNNSLLIEKKARNNEGIVYAQLGITDVYIRIKRLTDAKIVLDEIGKLIRETQVEEQIIFHKLKGKLRLEQGSTDEALSEFSAGEAISRKYKIFTNLAELLKSQIDIHELRSDWQKASLKYKEYVKLNEEMNSAQIKNQLDDLNFRNELIKKQLEIELVQEERDLAKKNEHFEKDLRIYGQKITLFVVILLISCIGLILFGVRKLTDKKQ